METPALQKGKNKRLLKCLTEQGFVREEPIAEALSRMRAIPFVDGRKYPISPEVLATGPEEVAYGW